MLVWRNCSIAGWRMHLSLHIVFFVTVLWIRIRTDPYFGRTPSSVSGSISRRQNRRKFARKCWKLKSFFVCKVFPFLLNFYSLLDPNPPWGWYGSSQIIWCRKTCYSLCFKFYKCCLTCMELEPDPQHFYKCYYYFCLTKFFLS